MKIAMTEFDLLKFAETYLLNEREEVYTDCDEAGEDILVIEKTDGTSKNVLLSSMYEKLTQFFNLPSIIKGHDVSEVEYMDTLDEHFIFSTK